MYLIYLYLGLTSVFLAARGGFLDIMNTLLEHEAEVNIRDKDGSLNNTGYAPRVLYVFI